MKDVIKGLGLIVVGLMTAILFYPLLHELGHSATAFLVGAEVVEFQILPVPYVLCNMITCGKLGMAMVGVGGMVVPFLITEIRIPKRFWTWYIWFVIRCICLLSFIISLTGIVTFALGKPISNEDITQVLVQSPEYAPICFGALIVLSVWGVMKIIWSKPLERCLIQFGVK